jgi:hypothetical protein
MQTRCFKAAGLFLCAVLIAALLAAGPAAATAAEAVQVFNPWLGVGQVSAAISGPKIAWLDGSVSDVRHVRVYDTRTGGFSTVRTSDALVPPAIADQWVVYADEEAASAGEVVLYSYNLATSVRTTYGKLGGADDYFDDEHRYFSVDAGRVTFVQRYNGTTGVWVIDLATKLATKVADSGGCSAISGDWVVWTPAANTDDYGTYDPDTGEYIASTAARTLTAKNLKSGETQTLLSPERVAGEQVDIDGVRVVWSAAEKVFLGNVTDATVRQIAAKGTAPRISGNIVVWNDTRAARDASSTSDTPPHDVYAYDLNTSTERVVADGTDDQIAADVDAGQVIWLTVRGGGSYKLFCASLANRPAPTCTLGTSATIALGTSATLKGKLTAPDGSPIAGARIRLQAMRPYLNKYDGDADFLHQAKTATSASDGSFSFAVKPTVITQYRVDVVTPAESAYAPVVSAVVKISPKPKVVLVVPSSSRRYRTVTIYCGVGVPEDFGAAGMPDLRGYHLENGKWVQRYQWYMGYAEWKYVPGRLAAWRTWAWSGDRSFVDDVHVLKPGRWRFRVKVSVPQWPTQYSSWKYLRVD